MPTLPHTATYDVDASVFIRIDARPGYELACLAGCLWITADGSAVDIELPVGERHVVTEPARLIVCGFGPGCVQVTRQSPTTIGSLFHRVLRRIVALPRRTAAAPTAVAI